MMWKYKVSIIAIYISTKHSKPLQHFVFWRFCKTPNTANHFNILHFEDSAKPCKLTTIREMIVLIPAVTVCSSSLVRSTSVGVWEAGSDQVSSLVVESIQLQHRYKPYTWSGYICGTRSVSTYSPIKHQGFPLWLQKIITFTQILLLKLIPYLAKMYSRTANIMAPLVTITYQKTTQQVTLWQMGR